MNISHCSSRYPAAWLPRSGDNAIACTKLERIVVHSTTLEIMVLACSRALVCSPGGTLPSGHAIQDSLIKIWIFVTHFILSLIFQKLFKCFCEMNIH